MTTKTKSSVEIAIINQDTLFSEESILRYFNESKYNPDKTIKNLKEFYQKKYDCVLNIEQLYKSTNYILIKIHYKWYGQIYPVIQSKSRDIRGICIVYDKIIRRYKQIRPALPVLYDDNIIENIQLDNKLNQINIYTNGKKDGMNSYCTIISRDNSLYYTLLEIITEDTAKLIPNIPEKSYHIRDEFIILFGSKEVPFGKSPFIDIYISNIIATYKTIELFIEIVIDAYSKLIASGKFNPIINIISFVFESVSKTNPHGIIVNSLEDSIYYIGAIIGHIDNELHNKYILDIDKEFKFIYYMKVSHKFSNLEEVIQFYNEQYKLLLDFPNSDELIIEPEGLIINIFVNDGINIKTIFIRIKTPIYMVLHDTKKKERDYKGLTYDEIISNPIYAKVLSFFKYD